VAADIQTLIQLLVQPALLGIKLGYLVLLSLLGGRGRRKPLGMRLQVTDRRIAVDGQGSTWLPHAAGTAENEDAAEACGEDEY
jgi:hypothetical protein